MTGMMHSIDVVIPIHGSWPLTLRCLKTLATQTAGHRVVVVDTPMAFNRQ